MQRRTINHRSATSQNFETEQGQIGTGSMRVEAELKLSWIKMLLPQALILLMRLRTLPSSLASALRKPLSFSFDEMDTQCCRNPFTG